MHREPLSYASFDKPLSITRPGTTVLSQFAYGPDRELVRHHERDSAGGTATRILIGDLYERSTAGAYAEHRYYVRAGGALVAIVKDTTSGPQVRYVHRDHLGSTDVLTTDASPPLVDRFESFDAWGRRRNPNGSDPAALYSFAFEGGVGRELTQEFTGHQALEHFELVHMGGRVYDPTLGRFLSPDPFVQAPESTQGLNRYAYVSNNPLSATDPTGYFDFGGFGNLGGGAFDHLSFQLPTVVAQFGSLPTLALGASGPSDNSESSFSFGVELFASGLQFGVNDHSMRSVFGSFAEGEFSIFQLPLPTFNPIHSGPLGSPPLNPGAAFVGTAVKVAKVGARVLTRGVNKGLTLHGIFEDTLRAWEVWNDPEATTSDRLLALGGAAMELTAVGPSDLRRVARAIEGKAARGALGDLTAAEVRQIQGVVNQAGRPLEVVGSAARGTRRGIGTDLPIGKGPGTRSDIDFLVPASSRSYFTGLEKQLPSLDPRSGIIPGTHNPYIGPAVRFEPGADPFFVPGVSP